MHNEDVSCDSLNAKIAIYDDAEENSLLDIKNLAADNVAHNIQDNSRILLLDEENLSSISNAERRQSPTTLVNDICEDNE